jgi:hypothetical protein
MIQVPVCNGELVDKLTILEIKKNKMTGDKLANVTKEYDHLYPHLEKIGLSKEHELFKKLYEINLEFWEYHDWQRERWILLKDDNFIDIELFKRNREEHILNDNRAKIKKEINNLTHSEIIEEKQEDEDLTVAVFVEEKIISELVMSSKSVFICFKSFKS